MIWLDFPAGQLTATAVAVVLLGDEANQALVADFS